MSILFNSPYFCLIFFQEPIWKISESKSPSAHCEPSQKRKAASDLDESSQHVKLPANHLLYAVFVSESSKQFDDIPDVLSMFPSVSLFGCFKTANRIATALRQKLDPSLSVRVMEFRLDSSETVPVHQSAWLEWKSSSLKFDPESVSVSIECDQVSRTIRSPELDESSWTYWADSQIPNQTHCQFWTICLPGVDLPPKCIVHPMNRLQVVDFYSGKDHRVSFSVPIQCEIVNIHSDFHPFRKKGMFRFLRPVDRDRRPQLSQQLITDMFALMSISARAKEREVCVSQFSDAPHSCVEQE